MTRIVFLRPKIITSEPMPYPHHGIAYMAAFLRKHGHEVYFIDCAIIKESYAEIVQQVVRLNPDAIGITVVSAYYKEMKKLARLLKQLNIPIIIGGVHVTALPELSLRETGAKFAVLGEGELTILELMNLWEDKEKRKTIDGIAFIENGQFKRNNPRELIEDLDILPIPAYDLIDPRKYPLRYSYFKYKRLPVVPIFTSRGCPHTCTFCASGAFWQHQFRRRSAKNVVDEMEYLVKEFGIREIQIGDDYFNCSRKHV
ncbi:MAG: B12-binding domain-containing radical SAM protein, partial [Candidatus Helarchaeota archaeon]